MAKKKLDLSKMYKDTRQTHDSTKQAQDIKTENVSHKKYSVYWQAEEKEREEYVEKTEKRINMAFQDAIYERILAESARLGVSAAYYINEMIRQADPETVRAYYDAQPVKASKDYVPRRKGSPAHRITLKFSPDVYEKIYTGAKEYNQTLTQYANLIINANTR